MARAGQKWAVAGLVLQAWRPQHQHAAPDYKAANKTALVPSARIGYTVSRKVGNAVCRNRAKRRLRAVAAQIMPTHARDGTDYVIIGRAKTLTRPFGRLVGDLEAALRKLDCYRD